MTSSSALLDGRIVDPASELHACLDRVTSCDVEHLGAQGQADLLRSVTRAEARLASLRLKVLAAAQRSNAAAVSGAASTGQWAAGIANGDQAAVHRQVALAAGLEQKSATQAALALGDISADHAEVIVGADRQLPRGVTPDQRATIEATLLAKARTLSPGALRKAARRALEAVEPDESVVDAHENELVRDREEAARAKTRLTLHENNDGTISGHFVVPVAQGQLLQKILQTITAPRRGRLGASTHQVGDAEARTDWSRARGEALCELIEHLPTDHLHPKTAATLVVTMELDVLRGALKIAGLDTGDSISGGEVRRLACNASLVPAVLDGASLPLDLGRSARYFSEPQRVALGLVHDTCAAEGCERPYAWCELHHEDQWSLGGQTDLKHAVPLCHFHHQRIHDHRYDHRRSQTGSILFHLRT